MTPDNLSSSTPSPTKLNTKTMTNFMMYVIIKKIKLYKLFKIHYFYNI